MNTPIVAELIKEKKTRKPRMAKVVDAVVAIKSINGVTEGIVKEEKVSDIVKDVEVIVEVVSGNDIVEVVSGTNDIVENTTEGIVRPPLYCDICDKHFKATFPQIMVRHNNSIYHNQQILRQTMKA